MWVVQASIGKPLYEGKIPLSIGCNNFVDAVVDGDTWVYVPQYDYRKYISPTYAKEGGRPRTKNTVKPVSTKKPFSFQVDSDIDAWLRSRDNICKYVNSLIRKDMEEQMNIKEQEGNNMGKVNAYNFVEKGCVFYHVIAESEEQCYSLAEGAGIDVTGMELELERMNVRDELGRPYLPKIEDALVH